jgi:class 3 adenylate cyclase
VTIWPTCGEQNPERARFCLSCGRPIRGSERGGEERRTVTVLFCDLVGFTARSDRAGPEDVKATLRPFHAELKGVIEHYQGTAGSG